MAKITLNRNKLRHNYQLLNDQFRQRNIDWAIVTKLLCGVEPFVREVIDLGIRELCDSRISNLKLIKEIEPEVQTVYIKPPARDNIDVIIRYADVSFNTEYETIKWLSEEAVHQGKTHKIIIMIELGDLREGVMGEELIDFYGSVFQLPNIEVTGIGANLNCLHGVMPSQDKLIQLSLYKQLIETKFNVKIPWVTGGTTVVIPLINMHQLPKGINHFRVGEALYFGADLVHGGTLPHFEDDILRLQAQIIEITEKSVVPIGQLDENPSGERFEIDTKDYGRRAQRAILDLGLLDINSDYLIPDEEGLKFVGASSDMLVVELSEDAPEHKVGDTLHFSLKYMGALQLLNSDYIEKEVLS